MIDILFVTDYVCPYCLVAKEALLQAIAETGIQAKITIAPMELTPVTKPQVDTYNDPVRKAHYQVLVEPCRQLGLKMKLPPAIVPRPYTKLAFEGRFFAMENGKEDEYNSLMYHSYFIDEKDIGNLDVLCQLVEKIGLDSATYRELLENHIYEDALKEANDFARNTLQPSGLPTIYFNQQKINIQSYTKEEMVHYLEAFADDAGDFSFDAAGDFTGCGPDGC